MKKISRRTFGKLAAGFGASVVVGATELRFLRSAQAVTTPAIDGTAIWGAAAAREPIVVLNRKPTGIVVHHTTNLNTNDFTRAAGHLRARQIQQSHFNRGWIDTGQQFTISRGGWIMEGRHLSLNALTGGTTHVQGAHAENYNDTHLGIECEGLYDAMTPSLPLWNKLVALIAYICQQYGLTANAIVGHRDLDNTSCPGDTLYSLLPQLRSAVAATLSGASVGRMWPIIRRSTPATGLARTIQYLLRAKGATITADGAFGAGTETAVKTFQSANGLTADGIVGASTWEKLIVTLRSGDSGEAVKALQNQLSVQGYSMTVDGAFGSGTNSQVQAFQSNRQLTVDGVVGINSWNHLTM
jgi:peptidoglycan hydrolase-like protein with peptidoglycan-binding domain